MDLLYCNPPTVQVQAKIKEEEMQVNTISKLTNSNGIGAGGGEAAEHCDPGARAVEEGEGARQQGDDGDDYDGHGDYGEYDDDEDQLTRAKDDVF